MGGERQRERTQNVVWSLSRRESTELVERRKKSAHSHLPGRVIRPTLNLDV